MKIIYLLILLTALVLTGCGSSNDDFVVTPTGREKVNSGARISVTDMTADQKARFVAAVKQMKTVPSAFEPDINAYDYFVRLHTAAFDGMTNAHMHPNFLPWHRELLRRFESELQRASGDPSVTIPFWDWAREGALGAVFADDMLGGDGDPDLDHAVTSGPFRAGEWQILLLDDTDDEHDGNIDFPILAGALQRNFGDPDAFFPTQQEVDDAIETFRPYDSPPYNRTSDIDSSFRNYMEGWWPQGSSMHNGIHVYVGGQMQTGSSPNDPVFFLHHANVDRLWALYQATWGDESFPEEFLTEDFFGFPGVNAQDTFNLVEHSGVRYGI